MDENGGGWRKMGREEKLRWSDSFKLLVAIIVKSIFPPSSITRMESRVDVLENGPKPTQKPSRLSRFLLKVSDQAFSNLLFKISNFPWTPHFPPCFFFNFLSPHKKNNNQKVRRPLAKIFISGCSPIIVRNTKCR